MESTASEALALRILKRKAVTSGGTSPKKRRSSSLSIEDGQQSSASSYSDASGCDTEDGRVSTSAPTPLSPISSKQSPRRPSELKTHHCPYEACPKSFNRNSRLVEHLRSHTNTRPFVCPHPPCIKDFLRETHLKHHVKSAHSDTRDCVCQWDGCGKAFSTNTRLKRHLAAHEGREKYRCAVVGCGQTFRKHTTLQKHNASIHGGQNPFICEETGESGAVCGASFETAYKLKTHHGRIHGSDRYFCTVCSVADDDIVEVGSQDNQTVAFSTYAALQAHNKTVHPPTCDQCGFESSRPRDLTRHIEIHHGAQDISERRTHICTEIGCGRGFTKKGNLIVHVRTVHSKERSFVCCKDIIGSLNKVNGWDGQDACGRAFSLKGNLEEHVRTAHLGLDHARKGKKQGSSNPSTKKKEGPSAIARLTGTVYDEDADRNISCLDPDCLYRFTREYDVDIHMQSKHGLADFEIQHLRAERDGHGPSSHGYRLATETDEAEAERALDEEFGTFDLNDRRQSHERWGFEALEDAAARGDEFWVGGAQASLLGDEWERDEKEMRRLIGGENDDDDDVRDEDAGGMAIDPALI